MPLTPAAADITEISLDAALDGRWLQVLTGAGAVVAGGRAAIDKSLPLLIVQRRTRGEPRRGPDLRPGSGRLIPETSIMAEFSDEEIAIEAYRLREAEGRPLWSRDHDHWFLAVEALRRRRSGERSYGTALPLADTDTPR